MRHILSVIIIAALLAATAVELRRRLDQNERASETLRSASDEHLRSTAQRHEKLPG